MTALAFPPQRREDLTIDRVHEVISGAILPFQPTNIKVYFSEKDFYREGARILRIEVGNINHHFTMSIDRLMMSLPADQFLQEIYVLIFNHYRYRPTLPVEEHIQLGED